MPKRKREAGWDVAAEVVDALHAAVDTCVRAAEAELRRHDDGGEKLPLLPELVELLKDAASDQKFAASTLKDVALLTCKSRAAELARQTQEEARAFAAAEAQDQEELKAIEARIRDVRKETAAERRSLQDFQTKAMACARQYRDLHKRRLHPLLKGPAKAGDEACAQDPNVVSGSAHASSSRMHGRWLVRGDSAREEDGVLAADEELEEIAQELTPLLQDLYSQLERLRPAVDVVMKVAHHPALPVAHHSALPEVAHHSALPGPHGAQGGRAKDTQQ